MQDDPKFRALLLHREERYLPPARLWAENKVAPLDGIIMINQLHSNGRITFKVWLRYVQEWTETVAKHYGTPEDIERIRKVSKPYCTKAEN